MIPTSEVVQREVDHRRHRVVVGVDTHKYVHVAVALDEFGGLIDSRSCAADRTGYAQLIDWAVGLGRKPTFAIEGTGSYGAGLTSAVRRRNIGVIEVLRTDRRDRRLRGKSDTLDAENAARAVLGGHATAVPKSNDGVVEMLRQIKAAKDVAVKARTAAMISLKAVIVNAPPELCEPLQPLSKMALIDRCAGLRPGPVTTVAAATKHTLRSIARRWQQLNDEIKTHETLLTELTGQLVPQLVAAFGLGPDTARAAHRRRRQHRPSPLRGRLGPPLRRGPGPGIFRPDHPAPAQRRRPPPSQRRSLPRGHRPHAAPRAHPCLRRPTDPRGQDQGRDHPLPQAATRPRDLGTPPTAAQRSPERSRGPLTDIGASTPRWSPRTRCCRRTF